MTSWTPTPPDQLPSPDQVLARLAPASGESGTAFITASDLQFGWQAFLSSDHWAEADVAAAQADADAALSLAQQVDLYRPRLAYKLDGSVFVRDSAALVVDTELKLQLDIGTYRFRGVCHYTADPNGDFRVGLSVPAGWTARWAPIGATTGLASATGSAVWSSYDQTGTGAFGGTGESVYYAALFEGMLTAPTAGQLAIRWGQGTQHLSKTTLRPGSTLEAMRV